MLKQTTKIKNLLLVIVFVFSSILLFSLSVKAAPADGLNDCTTVGRIEFQAGTACNDIETICPSATGSVATFCNDITPICNVIPSSPSWCGKGSVSAECLSSTDTTYCSDLSTMCSNYLPVSSSIPAQVANGKPTTSETASEQTACTGFNTECASAISNFCSGITPSFTSSGTLSSSVDTCYDSYTGWTYACGNGALPGQTNNSYGNVETNTPVLDSNYALAAGNSKSSVPPYSFPDGNCFAVELVPSGTYVNQLAWIEQSDCTTNNAYSVSNVIAEGYPSLPDLTETSAASSPNPNNCSATHDCIVGGYIDPIIRFLNIAVGIVAVIAIVLGGIQYSASRDNPEAVKSARKHILNALLGLVCYFLLYAFLNFIIPGGI